MASYTATVETEIAADQASVFNHVIPIDLASIFKGHGPLPAVTGVQNQTGPWDKVGQSRTVLLSDGSSAREIITRLEAHHYFRYTVSDFSGGLRFFTTAADGQWWFEPVSSSGPTHVKWSYTFKARSLLSAPVLWFITRFLWRPYMRQALMSCKSQAE